MRVVRRAMRPEQVAKGVDGGMGDAASVGNRLRDVIVSRGRQASRRTAVQGSTARSGKPRWRRRANHGKLKATARVRAWCWSAAMVARLLEPQCSTAAPGDRGSAESAAPAESARPRPRVPLPQAAPPPVRQSSRRRIPEQRQFLSRVQNGMEAKATELGKVDAQRSSTPRTTPRPAEAGRELRLRRASRRSSSSRSTPSAAQPMADAAKAANIPIVFVNRNPSTCRRRLVPVRRLRLPVRGHGRDGGARQARRAARATSSSSRRQVTNEAAVLRTQGCNDVVGKNPGMKVVDDPGR